MVPYKEVGNICTGWVALVSNEPDTPSGPDLGNKNRIMDFPIISTPGEVKGNRH